MTHITEHHDGLGLNDAIEITADDKDPNAGAASHNYTCRIGGVVVASIQFQHGPRLDPASRPGITEAALLVILLDRLRAFQAGPFPSRENAIMITKIEEALLWTERRARLRAARGVLGRNMP